LRKISLQLRDLNRVARTTIDRSDTIDVGLYRSKESLALRKRLKNCASMIDASREELNKTRDQIFNRVNGWTDYVRENMQQNDDDEIESYDRHGIFEALNDNSHMEEFIRFAEDQIHEWDSSDSEEEDSKAEDSDQEQDVANILPFV
jgi:hypothetical protein